MRVSAEVPQQTALGVALRAWRGRVSPSAVGLPGRGDRRVPGLRRREVAALARVSADYLTRLEQGRATRPSAQVLDALAGVLRLSASERKVLYELAGSVPTARGDVPRVVPEQATRLLERFAGTPLMICTPAWDVITCNAMWGALVGNCHGWEGPERNLAWRHFQGLATRFELDDDGRDSAESGFIVGLRHAQLNYPHDRDLADLIAALYRAGSSFRERWERFEVAPLTYHRKVVLHPRVGAVRVDSDVMTIPGRDLLMIALTVEPLSESASKFDLLRGENARHEVRADVVV